MVVERVTPEIDQGRYPIKRTPGERVEVEADAFTDGHDAVTTILLYRPSDKKQYSVTEMEPLVNDRWRASFVVDDVGHYKYTVWAWVDHYKSWTRDLAKRIEAGQDITVDRTIGAELVEEAASRAEERHATMLLSFAEGLRDMDRPIKRVLTPQLNRLMAAYPDRRFATKYKHELDVVVDRERARFSAWYELFPRSWSSEPGAHGTFRDVIANLPYVSRMGFDILYLPPIHPVGRTHRKGINNTVVAESDDVGSPWAIGGPEGGHKSIHPALGTFEDFDALVKAAADHNMEIALDIAFQCSPDHPYVKEHPEWFKHRPDGT
ncbi:MAG: maltotransferase domain-containing protein, partial [Chloroflexota bacterium]